MMMPTKSDDWMAGMTDFQRETFASMQSRAESCEARFESLHLDEIDWKAERKRLRAELTALVAEREEMKETIVLLRSRAESSEASNDTAFRIISERDGLRKRVVELDALKQRIADLESDNRALGYNNATLRGLLKSHPPADRDRELRERLVCAALTGIIGDISSYEDAADAAVRHADATLAAMRKEGGGA
jgi:hypothetical protein